MLTVAVEHDAALVVVGAHEEKGLHLAQRASAARGQRSGSSASGPAPRRIPPRNQRGSTWGASIAGTMRSERAGDDRVLDDDVVQRFGPVPVVDDGGDARPGRIGADPCA